MIEVLTNEYRLLSLPADAESVELDMGCGKGKFTLELAQRYPKRLVLASDVMLGRLRRIKQKVLHQKIPNVRLLRAESAQLVRFQLPWRSVDRIHILCPDPWPKEDKRPLRRLVSTQFLCTLPRVLKPGGTLHLSTDHQPYFEAWQEMLAKLPFFTPDPGAIADVRDLKTDFELQWEAQGKSVGHLAFRLGN